MSANSSEVRLDGVLNTAADSIILIDDKARIQTFNQASERMFGYTANEVIGKNVRMLMTSEHKEQHDCYLDRYHKTGDARIIGYGRITIAKRKDGSEFPIELSVGEAHSTDGRQYIGIIRDLTSRQKTENELKELQKQLVRMSRHQAIDEMSATIAHELNQPLTAATLYLQAMEKTLSKASDLDDGTRDRLTEIRGKAANELNRVRDIIQHTRSMVSKEGATREDFDVISLIKETIEATQFGSSAQHVDIDLSMPRKQLMIHADKIQVQQIIVNLLRNAFEAVRELSGPQVRVHVQKHNQNIEIRVSDSGPGIPPEKVPQLFKAFQTDKEGGLGLGLSLSRNIAQAHGGDLSAEPGGGGKGACFIFRLPIRDKAV